MMKVNLNFLRFGRSPVAVSTLAARSRFFCSAFLPPCYMLYGKAAQGIIGRYQCCSEGAAITRFLLRSPAGRGCLRVFASRWHLPGRFGKTWEPKTQVHVWQFGFQLSLIVAIVLKANP